MVTNVVTLRTHIFWRRPTWQCAVSLGVSPSSGQSPSVDLRLIVTDWRGSQSRAYAVAKFLRLAGRSAEARFPWGGNDGAGLVVHQVRRWVSTKREFVDNKR